MTSMGTQVGLLRFHFTDEETEVYGAKGTLLFFFNFLFFIGGIAINNVIVSGEQQRD